jgi:hypothetical protein
MDNLKPLLVHKFWMIFVFALLIPTIGWWFSTADLAASITKQWNTVERAFRDSQVSDNVPNPDWNDGISVVNKDQEARLQQSADYLQKLQQKLRVWPDDIQPFMNGVPYRGEIHDSAAELYRSDYEDEISRVRKIVEPFDWRNGNGKADFKEGGFNSRVPVGFWDEIPPTSKEMWDAQEDIWLLSSVLKALADANADADSIGEAPIKIIEEITFRGGVGHDLKKKAAIAFSPVGGAGATKVRETKFTPGFGGAKFDVNLDKEFGSDKLAVGAEFSLPGSGGAGTQSSRRGGNPLGLDGANAFGQRYVGEDAKLPFKTRGFSLKLVMDHHQVPEVVAQLTNMPWPVQILRIHVAASAADIQEAMNEKYGPPTRQSSNSGNRRRSRRGRSASQALEGGEIGGVARANADAAQKHFHSALQDDSLATVVIVGLMTIYHLPEAEQTSADAGTKDRAEPKPVTETPAEPASKPRPQSEEKPAAQPPSAAKSDAVQKLDTEKNSGTEGGPETETNSEQDQDRSPDNKTPPANASENP